MIKRKLRNLMKVYASMLLESMPFFSEEPDPKNNHNFF